jgi:hypothetical protein
MGGADPLDRRARRVLSDPWPATLHGRFRALSFCLLAERSTGNGVAMTFNGGVPDLRCAYALRTDGMFGEDVIRKLLVGKL